MRLRLAWGCAFLAGLLMGCSSTPSGPACTALFAYGLNVTVRDSVTTLPAGDGATVVARDGGYQ